MSLMRSIGILVFALFILGSCSGRNNQGSGDAAFLGNGGHLKDVARVHPSSASYYLIDVKPGEVYHVCMPRYFAQKYPGIDEELKASIQVWGHYIARDIPVEFKYVDAAPPAEGAGHGDMRESLGEICGVETNLVFGEAYLNGSAGIASGRWNYKKIGSKIKITKYLRGVFLAVDAKVGGSPLIWESLEQSTGVARTADEILDIYFQRNQMSFFDDQKKAITLNTIVHEVGHIWGMCDQYVLKGDKVTNCDPDHSSNDGAGHKVEVTSTKTGVKTPITLNIHSQMYHVQSVSPLYLEDTDIKWIRNLALRKGRLHGWPGEDVFGKIAVPEIANKVLRVAEVVKAEVKDGAVDVVLALYSASFVKVVFEMWSDDYSKWVDYDPSFYNGKMGNVIGVYTPSFTMNSAWNAWGFSRGRVHITPVDSLRNEIGETVTHEFDWNVSSPR